MVDDPRNPALEEAIFVDPEDREAFLVYADWLEGQGDPRAALIRLQPSVARPSKPVRQLFARHQHYLLGPLAAFTTQLTWRAGFVHAATTTTARMLAALLDHPSGRFVVELRVFEAGAEEIALLAARSPRTLRKLTMRADQIAPISLASIEPVIRRLVALQIVGPFELACLELPHLERLAIQRGPAAPAVRTLAATAMPRLRELQVSVADTDLEPIRELLQRPDLELERLQLTTPQIDDLCAAIVGSAFAPTLRALDLSASDLTPAGVEILVAGAERFHDLVIDIQHCDLDDATLDRLEATGHEILGDRFEPTGE